MENTNTNTNTNILFNQEEFINYLNSELILSKKINDFDKAKEIDGIIEEVASQDINSIYEISLKEIVIH